MEDEKFLEFYNNIKGNKQEIVNTVKYRILYY